MVCHKKCFSILKWIKKNVKFDTRSKEIAKHGDSANWRQDKQRVDFDNGINDFDSIHVKRVKL